MTGSTQFVVSPIRGRVGRKRINSESGDKLMARFREGTLERMEAVLAEKETKAEFIRSAVEGEITRREKKR